MSKVQYSSVSPYAITPQTNWYLLPIKLRYISADSSDKLIVISAKDHLKPYMLSYDRYGTAAYWWVFMVRNLDKIRDPIWDFTSGKAIYVPSSTRIKELLD